MVEGVALQMTDRDDRGGCLTDDRDGRRGCLTDDRQGW